MMDNLEYRDIFISEAQEYLNSLNEATLRLEKDHQDIEAVNVMFRAAHTLKGMAATMGYDGITELCHAMEDLLDTLRGGQAQVQRGLVDALFECIDELSVMIGKVSAGETAVEGHAGLLEKLRLVAEGMETPDGPDVVPVVAEPKEAPVLPDLKALRKAMKEASDENLPVYHAHVEIDQGCAFRGVRAFLVLRNLQKVGRVLLTQPEEGRIESGTFDYEFDLWIASKESAEEIKAEILNIIEISAAEVIEFELDDLPPEDKPVAPPVAEKVDAAVAAPAEVPATSLERPAAGDLQQSVDAMVAAQRAALEPEQQTPVPVPEVVKPAEPATQAPPVGEAEVVEKSHQETRAPKQSVRVNVERLDRIMNLVGEMVTAKIRLGQIGRDRGIRDLNDSVTQMDHVINELQDEVMAARMVPMDHVFNRFPRMIRDLARELDKEIELEVEGKEIELDRTILEEIAEPLVHLLRNAADHGLESTLGREEAGKDRKGYLRLAARREKNMVVIVVEDDGKGIDPATVKRVAIEKGILTAERAAQMSREEAVQLIAVPGFSMAAEVTRTSGRGVGVDAVKTKIEQLGGTLRIESEPGRGSLFQLRLPLTLAIIQALVVRVADEVYAVPVSNVSEAVDFRAEDLEQMHKQEIVMLRDEVLPVERLNRLLDVPNADEKVPELFTVLVAETDDRKTGLMVDEVLGQQEIAIKTLGSFLKGIRGFGGVTIQGDGSLSLILDIPTLLPN